MDKDSMVTGESPWAAELRARKVYRIARDYSRTLSVSQFVVALIGGWLHLLVDGAALLFYVELWNDIRRVYGRGTVTAEAARAFLWPNLSLILGDLLLDKGLGMLPIAGSVFCYWYSRAITFRLSALFGLLAAMQEDMPSKVVLEKVSGLVQALYPRQSFLFTLADPDEETFVRLLASLEGLKPEEAATRVDTALHVLKGDYTVFAEQPEAPDKGDTQDDGDDAASAFVIWLPDPAPFAGSGAATVTPEDIDERPLSLPPAMTEASEAEQAESPIPHPRLWLLPAHSSVNGAEGSHKSATSMPENEIPKPIVKRKHVATGRPRGRSKTGKPVSL